MAMVESQFANIVVKKVRRSRKLRKNYTLIELPTRKAKGRYPKGAGFTRGLRVDRGVVQGDRIFTGTGALVNDPYLRS